MMDTSIEHSTDEVTETKVTGYSYKVIEAIKNLSEKIRSTNFRQLTHDGFYEFTGHKLDQMNSIDKFVNFMHQPTDAASIGIGRMLFGLTMLIDIPEERGGAFIDMRWGNSRMCQFPLIHGLKPLGLAGMGLVYLAMWIGAIGITLGYQFKKFCLLFVVTYWYVFLLDKTVWNNHSYLYGLCGIIFLATSSDNYCSIKSLLNSDVKPVVPFWNYFLLKYQFFILYFYAGIKKMSIEWLSGYAMTNLGYHWVFTPFRLIIGASLTDYLLIHWFACIFDTAVVFFLIYRKTRPVATLFAIAFHLMNSRLFVIGMFPWVCLAELPLFYRVDWPRRLWRYITLSKPVKQTSKQERNSKEKLNTRKGKESLNKKEETTPIKITSKQRGTLVLMFIYCAIQAFLPFSHFITKGYNNWTNGLYGYSWDMMVNAWDTILVSVKVVDNNNGQIHYLDPNLFSENERWSKHADMAYQMAQCIQKNLHDDFKYNPISLLTTTNISIYFDSWCAMNGRLKQRQFDPNYDMVKAEWSPFKKANWSLPLLSEYNDLRPELKKIQDHVHSWNNYSDVLFIADFPGYVMENYITEDLTNTTLTVIKGTVKYITDEGRELATLATGQHIKVASGIFHKVETVSSFPSCFMYTFTNGTELEMEQKNKSMAPEKERPILPLKDEFMHRFNNYKIFLSHIANSFLYVFYGVPMPRRVLN